MRRNIEKWDYFELDLSAVVTGNPFLEVDLSVAFTMGNRTVRVDGFNDGDNSFKARFMPDCEGERQYTTRSNISDLNEVRGIFACVAPSDDNHGPVRVVDPYHFAYEVGSVYQSPAL